MKKNCLEIVRQKCENCMGCALGATRNNIVFSDGDAATARIVLIGEAPGETEDETGRPFVGRAGQLLDEFLTEAGISRNRDLYIINTVKCRPPENRVPTDNEKAACRKFLEAQIDIIKPDAIILCGATALKSFVTLDKKQTISKIRGQWMTITVDGVEYKAMTIFHPSYLLRNHSMEEGSPRRLMQEDLRNIKETVLPDRTFDDVVTVTDVAFGTLVNV
ncbi:MAG: uracil-DNA glycosylase [Candidatus Gastranaerophilaceae bacterium]|nr:uracil-DNA glycosylase [Candidatus Gastranaerophilaceae bacterium]